MSNTLNDMQSNQDQADFLRNNSGDYAPAFKFNAIGDAVAGTITRTAIVNGTDLRNQPQKNLVIEITTDDDQPYAIWAPESKPRMVRAIREACEAAGVATPLVGDRIAVAFDSELPATQPGYNPQKVYSAAYKRAERAASTAAPTEATGTAASSLI